MGGFLVLFSKHKYIYVYYIFMFLICLSWTNTSLVAPPIFLRIIITCLIFFPLLKYIWLLPTVLVLFVGLRFNSVAPYGYIPQTWSFYLIVSIILCIFNVKRFSIKDRIFILFLMYVFLVDLFNLVFLSDFFLLLLSLYLLSRIEIKSEGVNLFLLSFVLLSIVLSVYYFLYANEFEVSYDVTNFSRSTWVDPNYLGILLGCGLMISLAFLMKIMPYNKVDKKYYILFGLCAILSISVIVLQASRGALLSIGASFIVMVLFSKRVSIKRKFIFSLSVFATILVLFYMGYFDLLFFRIESDTTGSGRTDIWFEKINNALNNPLFIIGGGYQNAMELPPKIDPHNDYLALFLDYGILGMLMYIICLLKILKTKSIFLSSLAIFCCFASLTISPMTNSTGWCSIPFLITLIYRLKSNNICSAKL